MANRIITAATIIALLTPLAACGSIGGGLALEPEHQVRSIAVTNTIPVHKLENELVPYPYGNLSIDSTYAHGWTADPVTVLDGFDKQESFLEWPHTQEAMMGPAKTSCGITCRRRRARD